MSVLTHVDFHLYYKNMTLDITVKEALQLTSDFLLDWSQLTEDDVTLTEMSGGFCNRVYILRNTSLTIKTDPDVLCICMMIRLHGGKIFSDNAYKYLSEVCEAILFYELNQQQLGPKLYGVFEGGLLEEYIPSHTLSNLDLEQPTIRKEIARSLARYHCLDIPSSKVPYEDIDHIFERAELIDDDLRKAFLTNDLVQKLDSDTINQIATLDFKVEANWLNEQIKTVGKRFVFGIHDLNRLNCLIRDKPDLRGERVVLIDYDFSRINHRGTYLGNHFNNRYIDMTSESVLSGIDYPNLELRREFLKAYLDEIKKISKTQLDDVIDTVDHLLIEAEVFGMAIALNAILLWLTRLDVFVNGGDKLMKFPLRMMQLYTQRKEYYLTDNNLQ